MFKTICLIATDETLEAGLKRIVLMAGRLGQILLALIVVRLDREKCRCM